MGWSSGCYVMDGMITCGLKYFPDKEKRKEFYKDVMRVLEEQDWDTQPDSGDDDKEVYDAALKELHPDWYEDDE